MAKISKEKFNEIIKESFSIAEVCRKLGWKPVGGNYRSVHKYINEFESDVSHFTGQRSNISNRNNKHLVKAAELFLKKDSYIASKYLKWKLFSEGIKEYKCEKCGCREWNGEQIGLQLHHINGDDSDNRLENLQILCPNCHSQTDNFCGRNVKNGHKNQKKYFCKNCGKEIEKTITNLCDECYELLINGNLPLSEKLIKDKVKVCNKCEECGKEIWAGGNLCAVCSRKKTRKVEWPSKDELRNLICEKPISTIGKMYGVSDRSVRKWCEHYNLPSKKDDIKKYKEDFF